MTNSKLIFLLLQDTHPCVVIQADIIPSVLDKSDGRVKDGQNGAEHPRHATSGW